MGADSFLTVCAVFSSCVQTVVCLPVFVTSKVLADVDACDIAHGGCTDTVRESALKVDNREQVWPSGKALGW